MSNGAWVVIAIGLAIAAICIARKPMGAPEQKMAIPDKAPRSLLDALEPLTAGGKAQEAGPTINPTGQSSVMITYDKL